MISKHHSFFYFLYFLAAQQTVVSIKDQMMLLELCFFYELDNPWLPLLTFEIELIWRASFVSLHNRRLQPTNAKQIVTKIKSMDWEKKFNSILSDTKANLSRVKVYLIFLLVRTQSSSKLIYMHLNEDIIFRLNKTRTDQQQNLKSSQIKPF